jgi:quercetin dioxygenase-like cupin family protein
MAFHKQGDMKTQVFGQRRRRVVVHTDNLMMVIFDFDDGPADKPDPMHSHPHEQISYIVSGRIIYFLGQEQQILEAGDMVTIPPDVPHAIQALTTSVRLADAFTPVREDFLS